MQTQFINPRQFGSSEASASPTRASAYAEEASKLSASLARLNEEIQQMEGALAPALNPANFTGNDAACTNAKTVAAPLIETLETHALHANAMAFQVSALRARLCF